MKKGKSLLAIFSALTLTMQPLGVGAEMQDADGFVSGDENWSDDSTENGFQTNSEGKTEDDFVADSEVKTENDFIADPNLKTADLDELQSGSLIDNNEIELEESGEVTSGAIAGDASDSGIGLFSLDYYTNSYGAQLDGNAKALYDLLVQNYVVDYSQYLDHVDFSFEFPETYTFDAVVENGSIQKKGDSYIQATEEVKAAIQAATDAFSYDYPQAFWFRGCSFGYKIGATYDSSSSTGYRGRLKAFTFDPTNREISENAHTRMADFMSGVQRAVAQLKEQTEGMSQEQKIKTIHDYICQKVVYKNDNTLWVHSAASLFLDENPAFVCEGYAKSTKIFCYYMGINCACVSGTAKGTSSGTPGAHMWNYIQMEDGKWYLVDATWDDGGTKPSSRYLLVGKTTKGQYITIGEERVEYTSFSTTSSGNAGPAFILPELSQESYAENKGKITPVPTVTPEPAASATPVPTVTPEPAVSATPVPTVTPKPSATAAPTPTATPEPTATTVPTPTVTPVPSATATPTPTATPEPTATTVPTPTVTPVPSTTAAPTPTATPEPTATTAPTPTAIPTPLATAVPTQTTAALTLRVKQTYKSGGKVKSVSTTNKKIATVDKNGKITGKKAGKAKITIIYTNGNSQIFNVKVQKGAVKTTAISLNKRSIILAKKGKSFQLKVALTPVTSQQKVTYKSSNPKVATVNSKGKIVAKKKGTAIITIKSGSKKITCKVKVKK